MPKAIQPRHQATDCISHVPRGIQTSRNQERQIWKVILGCQKREQKGASSSFGRHESPHHNAEASGDRLPSTLTEDDDIQNLPTPGVDLKSSLLTKVKEKNRTNFPINTATCCISHEIACGCIIPARLTSEVVRTIPSQTRGTY